MNATDWLTIPQLAERLGVTRSAAWRHVTSGAIPAVRLGSRFYVRAGALDALAESQAAERRKASGE